MTELKVSELAIYPVKSLARIMLQAASVQRFGLEHDRRWMLVDAGGSFSRSASTPGCVSFNP